MTLYEPSREQSAQALSKAVLDVLTQKREFHLLLIGLDNAGKSCLLERIKHKYNRDQERSERQLDLVLRKVQPTVGLNIGRLQIKNCSVIIWDLGGQAGLRGIWEKYFEDAHAIVWVVDSADPARLDEGAKALADVLTRRETAKIPLLIIATKSDKESSLSHDGLQERILIHSKNQTRHVRTVSTASMVTAATAPGKPRQDALDEGIDWLMECLLRTPRT